MKRWFLNANIVLLTLFVIVVACELKTSEISVEPYRETLDLPGGNELQIGWWPEFPDPYKEEELNVFMAEFSLTKETKQKWTVKIQAGTDAPREAGVLSRESKSIQERLTGGIEYTISVLQQMDTGAELATQHKLTIPPDITIKGRYDLKTDAKNPVINAYRFILMPGTIYTHQMGLEIHCVEFIGRLQSAIYTEDNHNTINYRHTFVPSHPGPVVIRAKRARGELAIFPSYSHAKEHPSSKHVDYSEHGAQSFQLSVSEQNALRITSTFQYFSVRPDSGWTTSVRPSWIDAKGERSFLVEGYRPLPAADASDFYSLKDAPLRTEALLSPGFGIFYSLPKSRRSSGVSLTGRGASFLGSLVPNFLPLEGKFSYVDYEQGEAGQTMEWEKKTPDFSEALNSLHRLNGLVLRANQGLSARGKSMDIAFPLQPDSEFSKNQIDLVERLAARSDALADLMDSIEADTIFVVPAGSNIYSSGNIVYVGLLDDPTLKSFIAALEKQERFHSAGAPQFSLIPALSPVYRPE